MIHNDLANRIIYCLNCIYCNATEMLVHIAIFTYLYIAKFAAYIKYVYCSYNVCKNVINSVLLK